MKTGEQNKQYDLAILNGTVIDVEEEQFIKANIGISGSEIEVITPDPISGRHEIDATGKMVSPGFIDFHSHVDGNVYAAECLVRQGGTTTLGGERNLNGKVIKEITENGFITNHGYFVSQSFVLRDAVGIKSLHAHATDRDLSIRRYHSD